MEIAKSCVGSLLTACASDLGCNQIWGDIGVCWINVLFYVSSQQGDINVCWITVSFYVSSQQGDIKVLWTSYYTYNHRVFLLANSPITSASQNLLISIPRETPEVAAMPSSKSKAQ